MASRLEKEWQTKAGFRAVVLVMQFTAGEGRYRCGYVAVPKDHFAFGRDYAELPIKVHGGLTYAKDSLQGIESENPVWWLGFDCVHAPLNSFVEEECESIARQLKEMNA